jgi:hypothetical protein
MKTNRLFLVVFTCGFLVANGLSAQSIIQMGNGVFAVWSDDTEAGSDGNYAVDGDESTAWQSLAKYNPIIEFELDRVYDIAKVVMKWDGEYGAQPWDIYYSEDGVYTGSRIYSIAHVDDGPYEETVVLDDSHPLFHPFSGQFVQVRCRGRHVAGGYYLIKEFEMYGTPQGGSGIEKIMPVNVKIYPNPTSAVLNIYSESIIESISVSSINGSELEKHVLNAGNYTLSTSTWAKGVYLVKIVTQKGVRIERIIK